MQCPVIINCRDRLTPLAALVEWLELIGQEEIYLLDNDSTYEPLLEFYAKTGHRVVLLGENLGHRALWLTDRLTKRLESVDFYVYTDPDIVPIPECPSDALAAFADVLGRYPDVSKVGFGLRIDDLPDHYKFKDEVILWEKQFWTQPLAPGLFRAPIDTTFALYRGGSGHDLERAIRTGYPYIARHTPWYLDSANPDDEENYYHEHPRADTTNWSTSELPGHLANEIAKIPRASGIAPESPEARLRELEAELAAIKASRSYKWMEPVRRVRRSRVVESVLDGRDRLARARTARGVSPPDKGAG